ncbi:hypothetical protein NPIL_584512 [Nephila pilipes]|uniref:EGF-like domain-containing protein n=1 Tax=Nephila pilipes TaxID=299642 RepID=A0A8X6QBI7_NEPPI|nr:hypothetical protein NPIL_584512 [Nephila pilipes]
MDKKDNPCSRNPCQNGGICHVKGDSFKCLCKDVYFGDRCEKDPCTEKPCKNGGICEMAKYSFKCICRASFSGPTCEEEINEITSEEPTVSLMTSSKLSTPTTEDYKNATKSTNSHFNETTYTYNWTTEEPIKSTYYLNTTYELFNFTRDMNTSTLSPKDITTDNILTTFEPESNETISDNTTETPTSITDITNRYNWTSNEPSNFTHFLNTTYYPYNTTMIVNVTTVRPGSCRRDSDCLNGGVCRRTSKYGYFCDCPPNFTGLWCEVNLCEGLDKLCHSMGAICKIIGRNAVCECPKNKIHNPESGICEDACDSQKCLHGSCEIVGRYYKCNCHEGYTGFHCDEVIKNKKENYIPWLIFVTAFLILLCLLFIGIFYLVCKIHLTVKRLKSRVHIN